MNDDSFARLVAEEVKNKVSRTQREVLLQKENWDKWRRALIALIETLQSQLDNISEDQDADKERYGRLGPDGTRLLATAIADYEQRRSKIERFKFHVERRLDEVEQMITTGSLPESDPLKNAVLYENAIKKHKSMLEEFDIEPTPIDLALWNALDGVWAFSKIKAEDILE